MKKKITYIIILLIIIISGIGLYIWYNNIPYSQINIENTYFIVTHYTRDGNETATINNTDSLKEILDNLVYGDSICKGIANYKLESNDGIAYYILTECNGIQKDGKQASVSEEQMNKIEEIIINSIAKSNKISNSSNIEIKVEEK